MALQNDSNVLAAIRLLLDDSIADIRAGKNDAERFRKNGGMLCAFTTCAAFHKNSVRKTTHPQSHIDGIVIKAGDDKIV